MNTIKQKMMYLLLVLFILPSFQLYSQYKIDIGKIFMPEIESKLSLKQMKYYNYEKNNKANKKVKLFKLTTTPSELENAATIDFDIFGKEVNFKILKTKSNRDKSTSLVGLTDGNELYLTIEGDDITASLLIDNKIYAIVPLGDYLHVLLEIDGSHYKPEEEPLKAEDIEEGNNQHEEGEQIPSGDSEIDILVAYTPAASSVVSNMSLLINNAISQINSSFSEGGIDVEYHLVYSTEINIVEGNKSSEEILDEFDSNSTILSLRNEYRADLCFLITKSDNVTGIAWTPPDPAPWYSYTGFAIGNYDYVRDNKTFSHETGHNFGAHHNIEVKPYQGYKHGYLNESANFCTIMAYWTTSPSQRKNIWSDPYNTWNGYARGVVDTSENVRWLNDQRADIEGYRTFQTSGTITSAHHWRRDITLTGNVYVNSTLTIESDCNVDLAGYFIKSNGGSIVLESGAFINPDIRLQSGSTLLGFYPTISSAFSATTTGQSVHIRGTHTFSGDLTIPTGEILYTKSGSQMKFPSNKWLYVNGTLYGNNTTYTRTSGTWGGIKYQSGSSGSLTNCTINYANCGLYLYNSSPTIESNLVNYSNIYLNNSYSQLDNNYFNDAGGSYLMYIYGGSPTFFYNTIESNTLVTVSTNNGSDPWFGDGESGPPECFGYNILTASSQADGVIWAQGGSTPMLGYGDAGVYFCGYNSIIGSSGYTAAAFGSTTSIDAAWCWWGQYPAPTCYGDVNTGNALTSNPGGGSSLDKLTIPQNMNPFVTETLSGDTLLLWQTAMQYYSNRQFPNAVSVLTNIITTHPATPTAYKAINLLLRISRLHNTVTGTVILDELLASVKNDSMRAMLKSKKVQLLRAKGQYQKSIDQCNAILKENPAPLYESYALFDLFNLYQKDVKDTLSAKKVLNELKQKYPGSELTLIARMDNGEEGIFEKTNLSKKQQLVGENTSEIKEFTLMSNYPNPFNPTTTFRYSAPWDGILQVEIFNSLGQRVRYFKDMIFSKGSNHLVWNGQNDIGNKVTSGVYIVRFRAVSSQDKNQSFEGFNKVIFIK